MLCAVNNNFFIEPSLQTYHNKIIINIDVTCFSQFKLPSSGLFLRTVIQMHWYIYY
jgi:hypothetical protein